MRRFLLLFALAQCASAESGDNALTPLRLEQTFRLRLEPDRTYVFGIRAVSVVSRAMDYLNMPSERFDGPARNTLLDAPGPGYRMQATP